MDRPSPSAAAHAGLVEALSVRYRAPLTRFFEKKAIPRDEVEDLVQEVFLRLASRGSFESTDRIEGYLFTSAANLLKDRHRRLASHAAERHEVYEEAVHGSALAGVDPERALLGAQAVERLVAALYELPERTRNVFALYHFEDLSHREIAQRLGIAVSTIEKHMGRANSYLLERLEGCL